MSSLRLKVVSKTNNLYKVRLKKEKRHQFKVDDRVTNKIDNSIGTIKSLDKEAYILWDDGTRERIKLSELNSKVSYMDYVEQVVSPMNTQENFKQPSDINTLQIEKIKNNSNKPKDIYDDIFDEMNDTFDDIEDANPNKQEIMSNKIKDIKIKSTDELISMMKAKQMIKTISQENSYREKISNMNDDEYENLKNEVINHKMPELTEAELMLKKIKSGGPVIGDFSNEISGDHNFSDPIDFSNSSNSETRKLTSSKKEYSPEDNDVMENMINNLKESEFNNQERKLNFDGFKNIQGLKQPIQIQNNQNSSRQNLKEAIENLDWTLFSRN